jgi:hypothetical protein
VTWVTKNPEGSEIEMTGIYSLDDVEDSVVSLKYSVPAMSLEELRETSRYLVRVSSFLDKDIMQEGYLAVATLVLQVEQQIGHEVKKRKIPRAAT